MTRRLVEHRQVWPETVFVDCRVPSEGPRLAGTTPVLGASPEGRGPTRSQGRSPHEEGWRLRGEEGWRLRADSRRRLRLRLRPVAIVVRLRSICRTSTGGSNPQLGHSSVSCAVLHRTNDEWRLNHSAFGRSLGQVSSVQVTASSWWTATVPRHSGNGKARIVSPPARSQAVIQQGTTALGAPQRLTMFNDRTPTNIPSRDDEKHFERDTSSGDLQRVEVSQWRHIAG